MGKQSLVALDTQHIKQYVFPTDKLKEIRGASSILDHLNRRVMVQLAGEKEFQAQKVFANGGAALFLVEGDEQVAKMFGERVQQAYRNETGGGATLAFAVQEIPSGVQDVWKENIRPTLDLLHYRLEEESHRCSTETVVLPSHPLLRLCESCGFNYAEIGDIHEANDPATRSNRYCSVCWKKREEDEKVKKGIDSIVLQRSGMNPNSAMDDEKRLSFAWEKLIGSLPQKEYTIPLQTERPPDFHELRGGAGGKEYLALIYADGNGMGQVMDRQESLENMQAQAELIDAAVYDALSAAVNKHLQVPSGTPPRFPFDLLLVGGDDILMVTPATVALDVALTLAQTFRNVTVEGDPEKEGHSLSIGVILAPVSYPFGLLFDLAESTLKYAKKEGAKKAERSKAKLTAFGDTFINFMTVTGSTSQDFRTVYASLSEKHGKVSGHKNEVQFYATLRPYTVEQLTDLLKLIREGKKLALGRTKLHQVREAVLEMNLTSSVTEGLGVLRNWRQKQQEFVLKHFYKLGEQYQERYRDTMRPETLFPRVTFPWFADGPDTYRTSLLDFVELYDFVEQEGAGDAHENGSH